jgi:hypothetical protein
MLTQPKHFRISCPLNGGRDGKVFGHKLSAVPVPFRTIGPQKLYLMEGNNKETKLKILLT